MLDGLHVVLVAPHYPENIGSAARACANMGCPNLIVVRPECWDYDRAAPLARTEGSRVLKDMRVADDLLEVLAPFPSVYGTTARTGGWRKGILTPAAAAADVAARLHNGGSVAVVFGPEGQGLTNEEVEICGQLLTIPTMPEASSLNVSQAVMVVLYECLKATLEGPFEPAGPPRSRLATHQERELLLATMKEALLAVDFLRPDNTDYWLLPLRRFMQRLDLGRNEFNLLMGICRQVSWVAARARDKDEAGKD